MSEFTCVTRVTRFKSIFSNYFNKTQHVIRSSTRNLTRSSTRNLTRSSTRPRIHTRAYLTKFGEDKLFRNFWWSQTNIVSVVHPDQISLNHTNYIQTMLCVLTIGGLISLKLRSCDKFNADKILDPADFISCWGQSADFWSIKITQCT